MTEAELDAVCARYEAERNRPARVYAVHTATGALAYIGCTERPVRQRMLEHFASGRFALDAVHWTEMPVMGYWAARQFEALLIGLFRPAGNITHNPDRSPAPRRPSFESEFERLSARRQRYRLSVLAAGSADRSFA